MMENNLLPLQRTNHVSAICISSYVNACSFQNTTPKSNHNTWRLFASNQRRWISFSKLHNYVIPNQFVLSIEEAQRLKQACNTEVKRPSRGTHSRRCVT